MVPSVLLFSRSVVSESLQPHGLQHTRLPCPSPSPRVCSNSCPLSWSCHPTISFSVTPFSSCLQSFPALGSFPMKSVLRIRWPKYWSFSISPSNEYSGLISFRIDWFDLLAVQGTLKNLLQHHSLKASILWRSAIFPVVGLVYPLCESHKASRERDEDSDGGKSKPKEQRTGPQQSRQARGKAGCGQSARA